MIKIDKVLIYGIKKNSIAEEIGLKKGDYILSINGEKIIDVLDYKFLTQDEYIELEVEYKNGEIMQIGSSQPSWLKELMECVV